MRGLCKFIGHTIRVSKIITPSVVCHHFRLKACSRAIAGVFVALASQQVKADLYISESGLSAINFGYENITISALGNSGLNLGPGSTKNIIMGTEAGVNLIGINNISLGQWSGVNLLGNENVGIGQQANAYSTTSHSTSVGQGTGEYQTGNANTALGWNAGRSVSGSSNTAVGIAAGIGVVGDQNISIGGNSNNNVQVNNAVSIGYAANTLQNNGVALGAYSLANRGGMNGQAEQFSGVSVGSGLGAVSVGLPGSERQITNVAGGTQDTDAVNVRQLQAVQTQSYAYTNAVANQTLTNANNYTNSVANQTLINANNYTNSVANQTLTNANNYTDSVANQTLINANQYTDSVRTHYYSVNDGGTHGNNYENDGAIGTGAIAAGVSAQAQGVNAIAIGSGAQANGINSISIGTGNQVSGNASGAIGDPSIITGNASYSIGNNNTIAQDNTFVIGNDVTTTQSNTVVLGNGSTDKAATVVSSGTLGGITRNFAGVAAISNGVVSIGAAGAERQIVNVGAGQISETSTDAVNGSQLFATNQAVQQNNVAIVNLENGASGPVQYTNATTSNTTNPAMGNGGIRTNDLALIGANTANPVGLHNVANGAVTANSTDAVNGSQLYAMGNQAAQYTDARAYQLQNNIDSVAKKAYAGVAAAIAMESAPFVPGKTSYAAGIGYYGGQSALGLTLRRTADNGRWSIAGGISGSDVGGVAARVGISGVID